MPDINVLWYSTRGSAIVSQIMFTAVAVLGVLTAVRWHSPRWPAFISEGLHRSLALSSLVFLGIHIVTSVIDPYTDLGWAAALIPFSVDYNPLFLGLGSVATWLLVAVMVTSLLRDRIGLRAWRLVHWLSYAFWPVAIAHGIGIGTDTGAPWMLVINAACIGGFAAAVLWRIADAATRRPLPSLVPAPVAVAQSAMLNPAGFAGGPRVEAGTAVIAPPPPAAAVAATPPIPASAPLAATPPPPAPAAAPPPLHRRPPPPPLHRRLRARSASPRPRPLHPGARESAIDCWPARRLRPARNPTPTIGGAWDPSRSTARH